MILPSSAVIDVEIKSGGKKFFRNWIFRNLSTHIIAGERLAILGSNGSGKSTFLQILAGYESLSEGSIQYKSGAIEIIRDDIYKHVAISAPYLELIEEYTLNEIVEFHFQFKNTIHGISKREVVELSQLENSGNKVFKYFSSGMKQRVKLTLAMLSDAGLLLLDEPLSNLDKDGERWYRELADKYLTGKAVVVCSNQNEAEYFYCTREVKISDYK